MEILITGASGFLGRHLSRALEAKGHIVVKLNSQTSDLTCPGSLDPLNGQRFDQIYHLAVWTQAGDFCLHHPADQWLINQQINTNVLDWWVKRQPQAKLITMGTSCAYDETLPLTEDQYLLGTPIESLFAYGMTKRMLLAGLISIQKQYTLDYLYLIPSTLYGGDYHKGDKQMHFIFDLARKILRGSKYEDKVVLWGDGEQKRELIHVEDFVDTAIHLSHTQKNTCFNVGSGIAQSIRHFAEALCQIVGYPADKIEYDLTRYVGAKSKVLNVEKLKTVMPEFSIRPLEEGLTDMVQWFQTTSHY